MSTILHNGRVLLPQSTSTTESAFADCIVTDDRSGTILHVGSIDDAPVVAARAAGGTLRDVGGRVVIPGFVDGHMHLLMTGEALNKLDVGSCASLEEIRSAVRSYAQANPQLRRVLCRNWYQYTTDQVALASQLDDLDPRPIYIDANDLHSTWCNTAALEELGVEHIPDPPGGHITRDDNGRPSGLISENAVFSLVWPFLSDANTTEEKLDLIQSAFDAYLSAGYTGMTEMAMTDGLWSILALYEEQRGPLPLWITAYWIIMPLESGEDNLKQVDRAIELFNVTNAESNKTPRRRIRGIKLICDGVVDSCTASLQEPYSHDHSNAAPIWSLEQMVPVLQRADAAGLQCALHAIGDQTIKNALDALEQVAAANGHGPDHQRRHRIEHLETCTPEDARRLGPLGIVASVQPVHSDPAILEAWPKLVGPARCAHAFAYSSFADHGAVLAIGSDSPTAPHEPLPNLYVATTRRSARDRKPGPEQDNTKEDGGGRGVPAPEYALRLSAAVTAATQGSAYACFADGEVGRLEVGMAADFTVLDMEWDPAQLLRARVEETWVGGRKVFVRE
ncbi:amidohydrolase family protein [Xylariales sp. PMI_506]|nr:amidohydrolase family protein [Xylariales sp. PMI_506]